MASRRYRWTEARRHLTAGIMAGLVALLMAGCGGGEQGDAKLIEYQRVLAEALGQPAPERTTPTNIGAFPERDERLFEVVETREGMLNVYALRDCHITQLVAARNNQLGRVAPPSQQWIYELELWRRLHACWHSDVPDGLSEANRERLERLTLIKTEQLPKVSWNSLFDSEEWVRSFSRASSPLAPEDTRGIEAQFEALSWLHQATLNQFNPEWRHQSSTLENHLNSLRSRPLTAELLRALVLAERRLTEANELLAANLRSQRGCTALASPADVLSEEMAEMAAFAWLDQLESLATHWLEAIDDLLASHVPPPAAVDDYRHAWLSLENPEAPLPALRQARSEHRQHWQALARRCT